ncbi:MAG: NADH-ubiquinone oxidoreductase chain H (EC [uncultured Campylobacterales bacterium]|uniref:NADH-quinone oxidoreductase subunit H n=1 Tax=uncultured Campylobacterales bacterium TaxID=352960 RepID=A0A6S6T512_9BACT|nr:MAG: NADH-ubiquinone oxidoreductase chain H (EC [uncultured Campylobacterales bacterium]
MDIGFLIAISLKCLVIIAVFAGIGGYITVIERKILAFMQRRLGPMNMGPYGMLQIIPDMIKLLTKEDVVPAGAIKPIFKIAPVISVIATFTALSAIPLLPEFTIFGITVSPIIADINIGILFVLAVGSTAMYGPLLAGISSNNKWSLIGGARAVSQMISFEVIAALSLLAPIMMIGSLSLIDINNYQVGGIQNWLIFTQPIAFILFMIAIFAETNRTPFDLIEFEAEIVSGYATEYSGLRWGIFFVAEYAAMIIASFLVSIIFLGGFNSLWIIPGGVMILLKVAFLIFLFLWTRAAWPHIRPDQLMEFCWKILMPLAILNILITGFILIL